jgi:tetratricopeptide (TPR) repeat protein
VAPLERALRIGTTALGEDHGEVRWMRNSLARTYVELGDWQQAEQHLRVNLGEYFDPPRAGATDTADPSTLNTLATLYLETDRAALAEDTYRRSLRIDEEELGGEHPFLVAALRGIARSQEAREGFEEALATYERVLKIVDQHYAADHVERAEIVGSYAEVLRQLGHSENEIEARTKRSVAE